jgi:Uma2 family endonuclease
MTAHAKYSITEDEYDALEATSAVKHEYFAGKIYAMTGGTEPHNLIAGNVLAAFHSQLRKRPCRVYASDQRIKVLATGLQTYPDITIVCGQPQFIGKSRVTIVNPTVIIEVLSPSTELYDRGMKFHNYRTIETLTDYVLIAQDSYRVEHYSRQESGIWEFRDAVDLDAAITLSSIECTLALADVYEKVELTPTNPDIRQGQAPDAAEEAK